MVHHRDDHRQLKVVDEEQADQVAGTLHVKAEEPHEEDVVAETAPIEAVAIDGVLRGQKVAQRSGEEGVNEQFEEADQNGGEVEGKKAVPAVSVLRAEDLDDGAKDEGAGADGHHAGVDEDLREEGGVLF